MIVRIGSWCFRRRRVVVALWLVTLVGVLVVSGQVGSRFSDDPEGPDLESQQGFDVLETYFDGLGTGASGTIVFEADAGVDDPEVMAAMEAMFAEAAAIDGVDLVVSPYDEAAQGQIALEGPKAGNVAYATVDIDPDFDLTGSGMIGTEIRELKPQVDGIEVYVGGAELTEFETPESELIGLSFAVVILIVTLGSVLGMTLPIGVAVVGVGTGLGLSVLLSNAATMPEFALTIGAMIGLGVGIDYALFIVTRWREGLQRGLSPSEAMVVASDTAGRAVFFAGMTVVVSLLGLLLIGLSFVSGLALAAATTVLVSMAAAATLLPAFLGFVGERIETTQWRGLIAAGLVSIALLGLGLSIQPLLVGLPLAVIVVLAGFAIAPLRRTVPMPEPKPRRDTVWYRFSRIVQRRPWTSALGGTAVLLFLAVPVLDLRLGFSDEGNFADGTDGREAYDLLAEGFGPGFNGPLVVAVEIGDPADAEALGDLTASLAEVEGVAVAQGPIPDDPASPSAAIIQVVPESAPQDEETAVLVERLRTEVIPVVVDGTTLDVNVTGFTAAGIDFSDYLADRTLVFFAAVLVLSFLLLMVVFRSLLVPLKAVVMNMLSIGAAYGVVVAVFQWGWLADVVGIPGGAPIEPFIPMMMFAIVFGLSMDYEVFLLSRIKEEFDRTGDAVRSVADGLAATARVITAAAAIMVVVFGSFVLEDDRVVKLFGLGLATAVLLDATLVRLLLVPATMELLGKRNWWLPSWLDRILPRVHIEGTPEEPPADPEPAEEPPEREPALTR